ncbi:MAG: AI-2E family transporter, partial [Flavobacteriaceae bacterium]
VAVALYPFYQKLVKRAGGKRKKLISTLLTLVTVMAISIPSYSIFSSALETTTDVIKQLKNNTLEVTPPTEKVREWPLIGNEVYNTWKEASENTKAFALDHKDFILEKGKGLLGSFTGIMGTLLIFIVSFIIAVVFMYHADNGYTSTLKLANKLLGDKGEDMVIMSRNTIRSVVKGILLVAIIQAGLSFLGFKLIGLPAPGLFTLLVLMAAIVQIPVTLAVLPAIALAFSISNDTTHTIIFTVYILVVSLLDNFLKPVLLAKGLQTPTIIIFLGAIGGVILHGIIGLFVGTVVLALMHQFYRHWVDSTEEV